MKQIDQNMFSSPFELTVLETEVNPWIERLQSCARERAKVWCSEFEQNINYEYTNINIMNKTIVMMDVIHEHKHSLELKIDLNQHG